MRSVSQTATLVIVLLGCCAAPGLAGASTDGLDTTQIQELTGLRGKYNAAEITYKVSMPRNDLSVTAGGVKLVPAMGLNCWAAFTSAHGKTMVMGDQVLLEDQVNPVMSAALENGLEVTALHNHFSGDSPRVMFMHIGGMGEGRALAAAVGKVFARIRETSGGKGDFPSASIDPAHSSISPARIDSIMESAGDLSGGIYKVTIGRITEMHGHSVGNAMGVNTWAVFAGKDDRAVVYGDFAVLESELQGVLKSLRRSGIYIVAIHQHMTGETPRMIFLHYWGVGPTDQLARGLRSAIDLTGAAPHSGK